MTPPPAKILRVITRLNIGGPSLHAACLSTGLDPQRSSTCLVIGEPEATEGNLIGLVQGSAARVIRLPTLVRPIDPWADLRALVGLLRIVWRERPAVIHTHMAKAGALGRMAGFLYNGVGPGRRTGGRAVIVHTFHGHVLDGYFPTWVSRLFVLTERWLARWTDGLIAVSPAIRDDLLLRWRIGRKAQWRVIPLGLDLSALSRMSPPGGAGALRIGLVGRLVPIKNPALFLQALAQLGGRDGSVTGVVVGDGPLRAPLERQAQELRLDGLVRFAGWQRDLASVYGGLDAACVTSWNEGTPVSLIEAMAAGRAVVATDVGGVRDLLADGAAGGAAIAPGTFEVAARGILIRPGDAAGLAAALRRLGDDGPLRRSLGEAGRAFVAERHTEERLLHDIERLYSELLSERRRVR
ncbi:MAG: glycosyltransferase [Candidatus Omnitrophica bacterium]|nr:glycosyltransferase [Candidatus Omnitrophota bacterium]